MNFMKSAILFLILVFSITGYADTGDPASPLTRPEASGYTETSSYDDVMSFLHTLQQLSPYMRIESIFHSAEGRVVPLVIAGNPLPETPAAAHGDPRPVVYIQGNIHAGEVAGKDSLLMLLREMLVGQKQDLLKGNIYLVVPIFNADGNERFSTKNRYYMPNPEGGVGIRQTSQNYDLNRDYIKTDSREVRAILERVLLPWDPLVFIDLHTTDGSFHRETITYLSPRAPNWHPGISAFLWDTLYPEIDGNLRQKEIKTLPYGNFPDRSQPETGWATFAPSPRIAVDYMGLRNRFAILLEIYAYAPYRIRVEHCYSFLEEVVRFTAGHAKEMKQIASQADRDTVANALKPSAERNSICLENKREVLERLLTIDSFEFEKVMDDRGRPRARPILAKEKTYEVPYFAKFTCMRSSPTPWAYFLPAGCEAAVRQLLRHGVRVERVIQNREIHGEQFITKSMEVEPWVTQGHSRITVHGDWQTRKITIKQSDFLIPMAQPNARLAACLLEPEYGDSLVTWNFFNNWITRQWRREIPPLPIYKIMEKVLLPTHRVVPRDLDY